MDKIRCHWNRRRFVGAGAGGLLILPEALLLAAESRVKDNWAEPFDRAIEKFMGERSVPGGALAVVRDRRLVYARGYGWANREKKSPVRPDSLFRIASVSKPFTAVAVLKLVEQRKLDLEARPFELLGLRDEVPSRKKPDERWKRVTIRHLLHHTGGWDRDKSFDPMFRPVEIAKELGVPQPAAPRNVIRYMLGHPLDFDPGARYAYSNFGYCLLGRVIEKISGEKSYEEFVKKRVLAPIGIRRMRIGASLDGKQADGEVRYYTADDAVGQSVFPGTAKKVPWPYGGFHLEAMDAHGGWIASAVDLARFSAALDHPEHSPLLKAETFRIMYEPPAAPVSRQADGALNDFWYGCGWLVRPTDGGKAHYWHNGSLPGTYTLLIRRADGISFAALFNQRSNDWKKGDAEIDPLLNRAADGVQEWPEENLFAKP